MRIGVNTQRGHMNKKSCCSTKLQVVCFCMRTVCDNHECVQNELEASGHMDKGHAKHGSEDYSEIVEKISTFVADVSKWIQTEYQRTVIFGQNSIIYAHCRD